MVINISTENSFEGLTEDDDSSESSLSPKVTTNNKLCRSYTELRLNESYVLDEQKEKISALTIKLESAELEIERLLYENYTLAKRLNESDLKIKQLSSICRSTSGSSKSTVKNNSRRRKSINRTKLDFSIDPDEPTETSTVPPVNPASEPTPIPAGNPAPPISPVKQLQNGTTKISTDQGKPELLNIHSHCNRKNRSKVSLNYHNIHDKLFRDDLQQRLNAGLSKRKLITIADQQGKNLGLVMNDMYGEYFDIMCHTSPGACTNNVLRVLNNHLESTNQDDFLTILTGANDTNPNTLFANLYCAVQQSSCTNVILSPLRYQHHRHLNEKLVNGAILHIASQFPHCVIADGSSEALEVNTTPTILLAREIFNKIACKLYTPQYHLQLLRRNIATSTKTSMSTEYKSDLDAGRDETKSTSGREPLTESPIVNKFFRRKSL